MLCVGSGELGINPEALRSWVQRAEIDQGHRPGISTVEGQRIAQLERENRELKRANEILRTASAFRRGGARPQAEVRTTVLVEYIDAHRQEFGVEPICRVLSSAGTQVAPSTYYAAKARPPSKGSVADAQHLSVIRAVHAELNRQGHRFAHCTVHRLMRTDSLHGISRAKGPPTTIRGPGPTPVRTCWTATSRRLGPGLGGPFRVPA